jgi:predicted GNAT family N-acyltransferase
MVEIRTPKTQIEWKLYYDLRYRILRKPLNQPIGSEQNDGDATGEHFALFENGKIQAIARLDFIENNEAQVRFVAVETDLQGKGYGKKIMEAVENRCIEKNGSKLILHARDYAVLFYQRLNYQLIGPSYKLFDVLQHYLMEKRF